MEKSVITCDACKEEIHDSITPTALGISISVASPDNAIRVIFSPKLKGADMHACGIKCAMDATGKELLRLVVNVT